jgi:Domain of unknown function DUF29
LPIGLQETGAIGWLQSTEGTRGRDGNAHPHFHAHGKPKDSDNFKYSVKSVDNSTGFREGSMMRSTSISDLYDKDFLAWVEATTQLLKQGKLSQLDIKNLIEEVEDLGKRDQRDVQSNLVILLTHLLKWQYQQKRRSYPESDNNEYDNSWARTISEHRDRIQRSLKDSPSLSKTFEISLDDCYKKSRKNAARETGLSINIFPDVCGYSNEEILDDDFWPN